MTFQHASSLELQCVRRFRLHSHDFFTAAIKLARNVSPSQQLSAIMAMMEGVNGHLLKQPVQAVLNTWMTERHGQPLKQTSALSFEPTSVGPVGKPRAEFRLSWNGSLINFNGNPNLNIWLRISQSSLDRSGLPRTCTDWHWVSLPVHKVSKVFDYPPRRVADTWLTATLSRCRLWWSNMPSHTSRATGVSQILHHIHVVFGQDQFSQRQALHSDPANIRIRISQHFKSEPTIELPSLLKEQTIISDAKVNLSMMCENFEWVVTDLWLWLAQIVKPKLKEKSSLSLDRPRRVAISRPRWSRACQAIDPVTDGSAIVVMTWAKLGLLTRLQVKLNEPHCEVLRHVIDISYHTFNLNNMMLCHWQRWYNLFDELIVKLTSRINWLNT